MRARVSLPLPHHLTRSAVRLTVVPFKKNNNYVITRARAHACEYNVCIVIVFFFFLPQSDAVKYGRKHRQDISDRLDNLVDPCIFCEFTL